jgi:hypothetical protein
LVSTVQRSIRLSPNEKKLLELVPKNGRKVTTADLVAKFYGRRVPINGRIIVMNLIRSIKKKAIVKLSTSERAGPHPIEVWR